jgi:hypothetical protein
MHHLSKCTLTYMYNLWDHCADIEVEFGPIWNLFYYSKLLGEYVYPISCVFLNNNNYLWTWWYYETKHVEIKNSSTIYSIVCVLNIITYFATYRQDNFISANHGVQIMSMSIKYIILPYFVLSWLHISIEFPYLCFTNNVLSNPYNTWYFYP